MSMPTSLRAYADCERLFTAAAADPRGIRACVGANRAVAENMRTRLHTYRELDRRANAKAYPDDHPMAGVSVYDSLVVRIRIDSETPPEWWLYIEPRGGEILSVESLSTNEEITLEATEVRFIAAPSPSANTPEDDLADAVVEQE